MPSIFAANETTFATVDDAVASDAFPDYLTRMAEDLAELKAGLHAMIEPAAGERLIDVGCGTGADVRALAAMVAPGGAVDGLDNSQRLIEEARLQTPLTGDNI